MAPRTLRRIREVLADIYFFAPTLAVIPLQQINYNATPISPRLFTTRLLRLINHAAYDFTHQ